MSGSESSARGAAPEAVQLTVYPLDAGVRGGDPRVRSGRLKMLLVLAVCAAPVIASYWTYFVVRPPGRSNYGTLITPPRPMPALALRTVDGTAVPGEALRGQWLLVVAAPSACGGGCERLLHAQRQLREMLGRERERVDKVWLVTDGVPPRPAIRDAAAAVPAVTVRLADAGAVAGWLQPEAGRSIDEHLYLVDPNGDWMMRFPADFDPAKVKRDLDRLLRASLSWDRPGR